MIAGALLAFTISFDNTAANQAKENFTPAEWLPPREAYHCRYVLTYLKVAVAYDLSITAADDTAIRSIAATC